MALEPASNAEFEELLKESPWLIAAFVGRGCSWCARIMPALAHAEEVLRGSAPVILIIREDEADLFKRFAVRGVPVVILFKAGAIREVCCGGGDDALDWISGLHELAG